MVVTLRRREGWSNGKYTAPPPMVEEPLRNAITDEEKLQENYAQLVEDMSEDDQLRHAIRQFGYFFVDTLSQWPKGVTHTRLRELAIKKGVLPPAFNLSGSKAYSPLKTILRIKVVSVEVPTGKKGKAKLRAGMELPSRYYGEAGKQRIEEAIAKGEYKGKGFIPTDIEVDAEEDENDSQTA
jgi:hypothetical protein